jgi:hypothetical protein
MSENQGLDLHGTELELLEEEPAYFRPRAELSLSIGVQITQFGLWR